MPGLADFLTPERVCLDLKARAKPEVLAELCRLLADEGLDARTLCQAVSKREELGCTGIGSGVAVPHARCRGADRTRLAFGISRAGVPFSAPDGLPVRIFFMLAGPPDSAGLHLGILSGIARLMKDPATRDGLLAASGPEAALSLLRHK